MKLNMGDKMDQEESLDLLDLENEDNAVDTLPEATPFTSPRPKKPWLLFGLALAVIVLATWVIIVTVGGGNETSVRVDLEAPVTADVPQAPVADLNVPVKPVEVKPEVKPEPKLEEVKPLPPVVEPVVEKPVETSGAPVRVVSDRKEVTFNPDKPAAKPAPKPKQNIAPAKKATKPAVTKPVATASNGSIYVQFGSYSTRELAQSAEKKMRASHENLFAGKQFVILAAVVNGKTTYRLRVPFHNVNDANGFCRNAKSDGLDCYVAK